MGIADSGAAVLVFFADYFKLLVYDFALRPYDGNLLRIEAYTPHVNGDEIAAF